MIWTICSEDGIWIIFRSHNLFLELLQAYGQIWRPAQQVIRSQGKSVVFCCRGKHTEIKPVTDGLLLPCSCAYTCAGRCSWRHRLKMSADQWRITRMILDYLCSDLYDLHDLCPFPYTPTDTYDILNVTITSPFDGGISIPQTVAQPNYTLNMRCSLSHQSRTERNGVKIVTCT
jgi:hypothetical protein